MCLSRTPLILTPRSAQEEPNALNDAESIGKVALENDARTGEIRPHEVFCTSCDTWVALDATARYAPANWDAHTRECSGSM